MPAPAAPRAHCPPFVWPLRVYWEDTDARGSVNPAHYLKFFERARTEWLRALGLEQQALRAQTGAMFVVSRAQLCYGAATARLDAQIGVSASVHRLGRATLALHQQARLLAPGNDGNGAQGPLLCRAAIDLAWVGAASLRPARIPLCILQQLRA